MDQSLYERLGGEGAIDKAVELFYEKVFNDPFLIPFFQNTDKERQRRMQKMFLKFAFGGSKQWPGKSMRKAHEKSVEQGLNDKHFDAVVNHLATTLKELGVKESDIQEVGRIAESIRNDVLNK